MAGPKVDLSRVRIPPYEHQIVGIEALVKANDPETGRIYPGCFALFDEMGAGKTKQTIDAALALFEMGVIHRVVTVAPAGVRSVWYGPEFGELAKHLWENFRIRVREFHSQIREWEGTPERPYLDWVITNYEFIRMKARLAQLLPFCDVKTLLIIDESIAVKNHQSQQAKACLQLRRRCGRVVLLNGTPMDDLGDLYSQANIMDPRILGYRSYYQFRSQCAIMGGWQQKQIMGWRPEAVKEIQRKMAPYVLRRLKTDCLDLPEKLPPVVLTVPLTQKTWDIYLSMRDELVAWLSSATVSMAPQAITKVMRLAQITSGYLGGLQEIDLEASPEDGPPKEVAPQEIGREKLDAFHEWLNVKLAGDPNFKCIVWSRFTLEIARAMAETKERYPDIPVGVVAGGYKKEDREYALRLADPRTAPKGPVIIFGNPQSGGLGLNMAAISTMVRLSSDYSLFKRLQADDRIHRPGQTKPVSYFDLIATGPKGQRTIDHAVFAALQKKDDLARFTCSAWVQLIKQMG